MNPRRSRLRVPAAGDPIIRELFRVMRDGPVCMKAAAKRSGVAVATIKGWRGEYNPSLHTLTAVANTLGLDLVLVPRSTPSPPVPSPGGATAPGREPRSGRAAFSSPNHAPSSAQATGTETTQVRA